VFGVAIAVSFGLAGIDLTGPAVYALLPLLGMQ